MMLCDAVIPTLPTPEIQPDLHIQTVLDYCRFPKLKMITVEQFLSHFLKPIIALVVVLIIGSNPFQGSSESSEFVLDKIGNYKKTTTEFKTIDELSQSTLLADKPVRGSLIECSRVGGLYDHWAIYIGQTDDDDAEMVEDIRDGFAVHLVPNGKNGPEIKMERLKEIAKTSKCRVNDLKWAALERNFNPRSNEAVAKTALLELEKFKSGRVEYDLMDFNCEHFVTLCAFGNAFSEQAEIIRAKGKLNAIGGRVSSLVHYAFDDNKNPENQ
jgi:hypothetical protein